MTAASTLMCLNIADEIALHGYAVVPDFLSSAVVMSMHAEAQGFHASGEMHRAGVGQGAVPSLNSAMRGDEIHWLDESAADRHQHTCLASLESLRLELNRSLALGLFEFEGHFAIYPTGAFYRKHLDQFQRDSHRSLTCILYLNSAWQQKEGGQLRLYLNGENPFAFVDVLPAGGTLVAFLSSRFWHEVLPATRERVSFTGWYKTRAELPIYQT